MPLKVTRGARNSTTISDFVASGAGRKAGLVPEPPVEAGATKYLREDGGWAVPSGGGGAPTSAAYVVVSLDATLTADRRLQVSTPLTLTDGGANGDLTIAFSASWTGQTSITTLGTIATGTWQGATLGLAYGGTGATTPTAARVALELFTPWDWRVGHVNAGPANVAPVAAGCTVTTRVLAAPADGNQADAVYTSYATDSTANRAVGWWISHFSSTLFTQRRYTPRVRLVLRTGPDVTAIRIWIGWQNSESVTTDAGPSHHACLRFSTVAGDAAFLLTCKDGTTQSTTSSGVVPAADTKYVVDAWLDGSGFNVSINGGATVTHNANLPGSTTSLGLIAQISNTAASVRSVLLSRAVLMSA